MKNNFLLKNLYLPFILLAALSCNEKDSKEETLFELLKPEVTGVHFVNELIEDDSVNIVKFDYLYNGGGVATGDFNNDGLPDIFFTGNKVSCRLYLNKGDLKFEDVSEAAGVITNQWSEGVTLVDINNDGFLDIYVSTSSGYNNKASSNLLFVNKGLNEKGIPAFEEMASEYGIDDSGYNTQAVFFDYDKDGDLDLYILANAIENFNRNTTRPKQLTGKGNSTDRLYKNNGNGSFTDVSEEAGILIEGYGLGIVVSDVNQDGWPDIYTANDFVTNDLLYLNNGDGTFTNVIQEQMKHQSHNGMGVDVADYNNDGFVDITVMDMLPDSNARQKSMMVPFANYDRYMLNLRMGYEPQYVRNTLQLNNGNGSFSEVGQLAGIYKTDWSWAPLLADFDNDGLKDMFITNGYGKDITDLDYIVYSSTMNQFGTDETREEKAKKMIAELVNVKIPNFIYKNNGDLTFSDQTSSWGMRQPSISGGTAFADFDNDGDLDLVVNNLNDPAFIYRNNSIEFAKMGNAASRYLKIDLVGDSSNLQGLGTKITLKYLKDSSAEKQFYEHYLTRGYKSTVEHRIHFGLGEVLTVDTVEIVWPDGRVEVRRNVEANQLLTINYADSKKPSIREIEERTLMFSEVSEIKNIKHSHQAEEFADFKIQQLLPHKHSENGPGIAVGDVDGDGLEDFYIGGGLQNSGHLYIQNRDGRFREKGFPIDSVYDDLGALFFDADNDGDLDLYVVSGGSRYPDGSSEYQDRLYTNDGSGTFTRNQEALPEMVSSGSVVTAADFDQDGDLDLFVGGRVVPGKYPTAPRSYLLRNDKGKFVDITAEVSDEIGNVGMVTAAIWSDFDQDGLVDLVLTGEWMPITVMQQVKTGSGKIKFDNITEDVGLSNTSGWWNSIIAGDFDNDGDPDYVAGNLGLNSRYKASVSEPLSVYAKDFDNNGSIDPIMFYHIYGKSYPAHSRDEIIGQLPYMRHRFQRYADYGKTSFENFFKEGELDGALTLRIQELQTSYLENLGDGKFRVKPMPVEVQFSPVYGMVSKDVNEDGHLDLLLIGNSYGSEKNVGRYDASVGNYLEGDGKGNFLPIPARHSGFYVDGNARALSEIVDKEGNSTFLVSQYADSLKIFQSNIQSKNKIVDLQPLDQRAEIKFENGEIRKVEFFYSSSYLSQSSRKLVLGDDVEAVTIYDYSGNDREVSLRSSVLTLGK